MWFHLVIKFKPGKEIAIIAARSLIVALKGENIPYIVNPEVL